MRKSKRFIRRVQLLSSEASISSPTLNTYTASSQCGWQMFVEGLSEVEQVKCVSEVVVEHKSVVELDREVGESASVILGFPLRSLKVKGLYKYRLKYTLTIPWTSVAFCTISSMNLFSCS
jgi:hypothetical protein